MFSLVLILSNSSISQDIGDLKDIISEMAVAERQLDLSCTVSEKLERIKEFNRVAQHFEENRPLLEENLYSIVKGSDSDFERAFLYYIISRMRLDLAKNLDAFIELMRLSADDPVLQIDLASLVLLKGDSSLLGTVVTRLLEMSETERIGVFLVGYSAKLIKENGDKLGRIWDEDRVDYAVQTTRYSWSQFLRQNVADAFSRSGYMPPAMEDRVIQQVRDLERSPLLIESCWLALAICGSQTTQREAIIALNQSCKGSIGSGIVDPRFSFRYLATLKSLNEGQKLCLLTAGVSDSLPIRTKAIRVLVEKNDQELIDQVILSSIKKRESLAFRSVVGDIEALNESQVPMNLLFSHFAELDLASQELVFQLFLRRVSRGNFALAPSFLAALRKANVSQFEEEANMLETMIVEQSLNALVPSYQALPLEPSSGEPAITTEDDAKPPQD